MANENVGTAAMNGTGLMARVVVADLEKAQKQIAAAIRATKRGDYGKARKALVSGGVAGVNAAKSALDILAD